MQQWSKGLYPIVELLLWYHLGHMLTWEYSGKKKTSAMIALKRSWVQTSNPSRPAGGAPAGPLSMSLTWGGCQTACQVGSAVTLQNKMTIAFPTLKEAIHKGRHYFQNGAKRLQSHQLWSPSIKSLIINTGTKIKEHMIPPCKDLQ